MASNVLTLHMSMRWWVMPYVHTLILFCQLTGCEPDFNKVCEFIVRHGFRIHTEPAK